MAGPLAAPGTGSWDSGSFIRTRTRANRASSVSRETTSRPRKGARSAAPKKPAFVRRKVKKKTMTNVKAKTPEEDVPEGEQEPVEPPPLTDPEPEETPPQDTAATMTTDSTGTRTTVVWR